MGRAVHSRKANAFALSRSEPLRPVRAMTGDGASDYASAMLRDCGVEADAIGSGGAMIPQHHVVLNHAQPCWFRVKT